MFKVQYIIKDRKLHLYSFIYRRFGKYLSDRNALNLLYYISTKKDLDLSNPKTYREKIQWLKLNDRNPAYTKLVDKYLVKDYVGRAIGFDHVIPTLGVWESPEDIDFGSLPDRFVLKCNHNSHLGLSICNDKSAFDTEKAKNELRKGLSTDHFMWGREWAYKDVPRKIIAEKYIHDDSCEDGVLTDYKFFCFNGKAKIMYISHDIAKDARTDFFDMEFNHLDIRMQDKNSDILPEKPPFFDEMKEAAEFLSRGIPFVRVDFYIADNTFYFGELTFYPSRGLAPIHPEKWDSIIGEWIDLSTVQMQLPEIMKSEDRKNEKSYIQKKLWGEKKL